MMGAAPAKPGPAVNIRKKFKIPQGRKVRLREFDPAFTPPGESKRTARHEIRRLGKRMDDLQYRLFAESRRSLLICLQGLDASGKDGVIRHVLGNMNPQSCRVVGFKQPSAEEASHHFLWRIDRATPARGEVVIFNRSHYEDVLIARVHDLVPRAVWSRRYGEINRFEKLLVENGTTILKFFLHLSKEEQLKRFGQRLKDPSRRWKISEADYGERKYWESYTAAYEEALGRCSTRRAPWYVIPSDHKWFRNLAISRIIVEAMEGMDMQLPRPRVDLAAIRIKYHQASREAGRGRR